MPREITKKDIEKLADLARIDIHGKEEDLLKDTAEIIGYFEELNQINTDNIAPVTGATDFLNRTREDKKDDYLVGKGVKSFPETENESLVVPEVMNAEK